jgi:hypothetical protein
VACIIDLLHGSGFGLRTALEQRLYRTNQEIHSFMAPLILLVALIMQSSAWLFGSSRQVTLFTVTLAIFFKKILLPAAH